MHPEYDHVRIRLLPAAASLMLIACLPNNAALAQTRPSIADLQTRISTLEMAPIQDLNGYVTMDLGDPTRPTLRVAGANLQVVNGLGTTNTINGLGNVIVGYDETDANLLAVCSLGQYLNQTTCTSGGGTWAVAHKSGSHNLVVGPNHRYSRFGGLIAGAGNTVNADSATVSGGLNNTALGTESSVIGGYLNAASGITASVTGGQQNTASGTTASVTGGALNTASATQATVSGGLSRMATGIRNWVAGALLQTN